MVFTILPLCSANDRLNFAFRPLRTEMACRVGFDRNATHKDCERPDRKIVLGQVVTLVRFDGTGHSGLHLRRSHEDHLVVDGKHGVAVVQQEYVDDYGSVA